MKPKVAQPLIIKKYENRRLYNTLTSQYINQEQVAQLVREGYDVCVIDAATGDDITRLILAQIVLEDVKTPDSAFPLDVLRQMIVASGKATQENTVRYMKAMMEMYQNAYRAMPSPLNGFGLMPNLWGQNTGEQVHPQASGKSAENPEAHDPAAHRQSPSQLSEVTELRRRIEELEATLSSVGGGAKRPGTKARKTKSRRKS